jgi:hypothetical protein
VGFIVLLHGTAYQSNPAIAFAGVGMLFCIVASIFIVGACSSGRRESLSPRERAWETVYSDRVAGGGDDDDDDDDEEEGVEHNSLVTLGQIELDSSLVLGDSGNRVFESVLDTGIDGFDREEDPFYLDLVNYEDEKETEGGVSQREDEAHEEKADAISFERRSYSYDVNEIMDDFASHQHVIEFKKVEKKEELLLGDDTSNQVLSSSAKSSSPFQKVSSSSSAIQPRKKSLSTIPGLFSSEKPEDQQALRRSSLHTSRVLTPKGGLQSTTEVTSPHNLDGSSGIASTGAQEHEQTVPSLEDGLSERKRFTNLMMSRSSSGELDAKNQSKEEEENAAALLFLGLSDDDEDDEDDDDGEGGGHDDDEKDEESQVILRMSDQNFSI